MGHDAPARPGYGLVLLVLTYRLAKPLIHKLVVAILKAQQATLDGGGAPAEELRKRAVPSRRG